MSHSSSFANITCQEKLYEDAGWTRIRKGNENYLIDKEIDIIVSKI
jgi:hypothetical protein